MSREAMRSMYSQKGEPKRASSKLCWVSGTGSEKPAASDTTLAICPRVLLLYGLKQGM
jgi:hypothetical protein